MKVAAVLVLIAVNGFFVANEFALLALDRDAVETEAAAGSKRARSMLRLMQRLSFHLSTAQLGITLSSLILGFLAEPLIGNAIDPLLEPVLGSGSTAISLLLALVLATIGQMVLGELIPKAVAISRPRATMRLLGRGMEFASALFGPAVRFLNGAANATVRRLGMEPKEELASSRTLEELRVVIRSSAEEGSIDTEAHTLLERSIRFGDKTAADALVPRVRIVSVDRDATVPDLLDMSKTTGHSRFLVIGDDLDDVLGVVHVKSVYGVPFDERATRFVQSIMDVPFVVPETRDLDSLLVEIRDRRDHLAVVVDEHGGTAGIITIEDMLEEIVGEIDDEHDVDGGPLVRRGIRGYQLSGTLHEDEVADACGFRMPGGDYETLAGFMLDQLGHIPEVDEVVSHEGWTFTVLERERLRISVVGVMPPNAGEAASANRQAGP